MREHSRIMILALALLLATAAWAAQTQSVQVRRAQLRAKPSFLGKIVARVSYGDRLDVLESRAGWSRVRDADGHEGWIHGSALSAKKLALESGDRDVATGTSGDEIALAGKGFNDKVEAEYRAENPTVDFAWIDKMESWKVSAEKAAAFLAAGGVHAAAGGAQ